MSFDARHEADAHDLPEERAGLLAAIQALDVGVVVLSASHDVLVCTPVAQELFGLRPGRLDPGSPLLSGDFVHENGTSWAPSDTPIMRALVKGVFTNEALIGQVRPEGTRWLSVDARPLYRAGRRRPHAAVATFRDITERRAADHALIESERMFRKLAENSTDYIVLADPSGVLLYASPAIEKVLGWTADDRRGLPPYSGVHEDDIPAAIAAMEALRSSRDQLPPIRVRLLHKAGHYVWTEMVVQAIRDEHGEVIEIQATTRDISEQVAHEELLSRMALTDTLTGLSNRAAAVAWLERAQAQGSRIAVLYLDVHRFKVVNDSLGHAVGDRLLVAVASRLSHFAQESDLLARLGGDEFVLVREGISEAAALELADALAGLFEQPVEVDGHPLAVSASIGIVTGPVAGDPYRLLREADAAMYDAKEQGRARAVVYSSVLGARAEQRLIVETELRRALDEGQIAPYYQPIVDLGSGVMVGLEVLVRWHHPVRGTLDPAEFLAVAEDSGLMIRLGRTVISQALRQLACWRAELPAASSLELAINLSGPELSGTDTVAWLLGMVGDSGLPPGAITVEVLESTTLSSEPILAALAELRSHGLRVGLDDFGTGNSSLTNLRRVHTDLVKIDSSFVRRLGHEPRDEAIVLAMRDLAASFHAQLLAEGVETAEQANWLLARGIPYAQGYLFGRPQPAETVTELLARAPSRVRLPLPTARRTTEGVVTTRSGA